MIETIKKQAFHILIKCICKLYQRYQKCAWIFLQIKMYGLYFCRSTFICQFKHFNHSYNVPVYFQGWMRAKLERIRFLRLREATVTLQQVYRKHYQHRQRAAACLQAAVRGWLARRSVRRQHQAATAIQVRRILA